MKTKKRKSFLVGIPAWGLILLTLVLAFPVLMFLAEIISLIFSIPEDNVIAEWVFYVFYNIIIALGCYDTCRLYPKSIFYVPVLCNIIGIYSAFDEETFWISSLWVIICSGWVLSIITSLLGVYIGRRKLRSEVQ